MIVIAIVILLLQIRPLFAANELEHVSFQPDLTNLKGSVSAVPDLDNNPCAIIRIESDVIGRIDLTSITVFKSDVVSTSIIDHYISYRERYIVLSASGYLPFHYKIPVEMEKGKLYILRVQTKGGPAPAGLGSLRIETDPAGAAIKLNSIPVPGSTPLTLSDQPSGVHALVIEKDGFSSVEENITIEKDKTTTRRWTLKKLVAGLRVNSNPSGAKVVLEGDDLGMTPVDRADLTPGEGTLVVSLKGYETVTRPIRLIAGQLKTENVDLFAQTGSVSITCDPTGATVFLDGASVGTYTGSPITREKLSLGSHTVRAALEGYEEANKDFTIEYNKSTPISVKLTPKPGALYVTTTPEGADISLDGRSTGKITGAKFENVSAGSHQLRLTLAGYGDIEKKVIVKPGRTETISETMTVTPKIEPGSTAVSGGLQSIQGPLAGMTFVKIPGGSYQMGSKDGGERPIHRVDIKSFRMLTTEVTQKMWQELMGSNPSYFKGENLPVERVSWNDCQEFIRKLNQRDPGKGYRLPSESEWEYACRAGTTTTYNLGDSKSDLDRAGWFNSNNGLNTRPVGQKAANAWGLYDMHGNVWEWCEDWYHDSYNGAPNNGSAWVAGGGTYRVLRGGSWYTFVRRCRSAFRYSNFPGSRSSHGGFRVVASFPSP